MVVKLWRAQRQEQLIVPFALLFNVPWLLALASYLQAALLALWASPGTWSRFPVTSSSNGAFSRRLGTPARSVGTKSADQRQSDTLAPCSELERKQYFRFLRNKSTRRMLR